MTVFRSDEDRNKYLCFIREETTRFGVEIISWCLMTNHVHFVAVPAQETALARAFGEARRGFLLSDRDDLNDSLRKATKTGRPAGNTAFLGTVEQVTKRNLRYGKKGRPRKNIEK